MKSSAWLLVCCIVAVAAVAQPSETRSTLCQAVEVPVDAISTDRRLIGCGAGFADNLLWHLDRSDSADGHLDQSLLRRVTGRGAVIYVMDTGVRRDHNEFARATGTNVIAGINVAIFNTVNPPGCADPVLAPCSSSPAAFAFLTHGTAVASVAAGATTGVAPDASIVAVRVAGIEDLWISGLQKVIEHAFAPTTPPFHTAIVNMSTAVDRSTPAQPPARMEALIRNMIGGVDAAGNPDPNGKRFFFVAAAGNDCSGRPITWYPALFGPIDGLVTVGGITPSNQVWSGSCAGASVELLAPAENMFVASMSGVDHYRYKPDVLVSGTSYATPYVSGMAARMLEINRTLTPVELEQLLKASPSRATNSNLPVVTMRNIPRRRAVR